MDGYKYFGYLVDEASEDFFQKTAEEIAKEASRSPKGLLMELFKKKPKRPVKPPLEVPPQKLTESQKDFIRKMEGLDTRALRSDPAVEKAILEASKGGYMGHGGVKQAAHLAVLIRKSAEMDLTKTAEESLLSDWDSYPSLLNSVAAASPNEPLGMSKTAALWADAVEEVLGENEELTKVADALVLDALWADAVNEGLTKEAIGGIRAFFSAAKATPGALWKGLKALRHPIKSVRQLGVRGAAGKAGEAVKAPIRKAYSARKAQILGKHVGKARQLRRGAIAQAEALKSRIARTTNPRRRAELASRLTSVEKSLKAQTKRQMKAQRQLTKAERKSGGDYVPTTARQRAAERQAKELRRESTKARAEARTSAREGAREAGRAAEGGAARRGRRDTGTGTEGGYETTGTGRGARETARDYPGPQTRAEVDDLVRRGSSKKQPARPAGADYQRRQSRGAGRESGGGGGRPAPESPPRGTSPADVQNKPGYGEIYNKWSEGGWKALTDAEKRKVYVLAGGVFVGQRALMDRPII